MDPLIPPHIRNWLYPIATAAVALLGGYGIIEQQHEALWIALAAAVLGTGTATVYRPSKTLPPDDEP